MEYPLILLLYILYMYIWNTYIYYISIYEIHIHIYICINQMSTYAIFKTSQNSSIKGNILWSNYFVFKIYSLYATFGVFLQGKLTFWNFKWLKLDWLNIVHQVRHLFCGHGLAPSSALEAGIKITFPESALALYDQGLFSQGNDQLIHESENHPSSSENDYCQ